MKQLLRSSLRFERISTLKKAMRFLRLGLIASLLVVNAALAARLPERASSSIFRQSVANAPLHPKSPVGLSRSAGFLFTGSARTGSPLRLHAETQFANPKFETLAGKNRVKPVIEIRFRRRFCHRPAYSPAPDRSDHH